jgi:glycerophosphoryl diester phosphodiesterase
MWHAGRGVRQTGIDAARRRALGTAAGGAAALAALTALAFVPRVRAQAATPRPAAPAAAFDLQGHRGARGLAPENTLAGFRRALAVGVDTLELDLQCTRDGVLVVHHDPRLNAAITRRGGRWLPAAEPGPAIASLTLAELAAYDVGRLDPTSAYGAQWPQQQPADGERVPTLAAVFELVRALERTQPAAAAIRFNVETKLSPDEPALYAAPEVLAERVVAAIERAGLAARCTVQSFDWRTLLAVRRLRPGLATAALSVRTPRTDNVGAAEGRWTAGLRLADHGGAVPRLVHAAGAAVWSPLHTNLDEPDLALARSLGLTVIPWTVNEPAAIARLLGLGVDGVITDHPERVRTELLARGRPLPAAFPT